MGSKLTIQQKKDYAKVLFTREKLAQKDVAQKAGVSEKTISKWVNDENWKRMRQSILLTRQEQMQNLLMELEELNAFIQSKAEGFRFATSKEADTRRKLIRDIKELETKASLAEIIETCKRFIKWLQPVDYAKAKEVAALFDEFIKDNLR